MKQFKKFETINNHIKDEDGTLINIDLLENIVIYTNYKNEFVIHKFVITDTVSLFDGTYTEDKIYALESYYNRINKN